MHRYVCVHGHFYQPPRENPWLEEIEIQDEAYPFHDWNARITDECYGPNSAARILNEAGEIRDIVNNYSRISFNFGPTLLTWLERHESEVYRAILEADRASQERFGGKGSALAQVYNHMIMPLANERDQRTQTIWGIRDFTHRFGRQPEGMWLSETAVDVPSLEALAEQGIRFTILEPHQARRVRPLGGRTWTDVSGSAIDTHRPYRVLLPSGNTIDVFFYDGATSRAVAFENLLSSGEVFAQRLVAGLSAEPLDPQLSHIATDGESYGHHHRFGEMALAYALDHIEQQGLVQLTNYPEFLQLRPPEYEVEIVPNTSWSCSHGVERWRSGCGCGEAPVAGWTTGWRAPLREALDWLRDDLAQRYEEQAAGLLADPWQARDEYIEIILDRSPENIDRVLSSLAGRRLNGQETVRALTLLEMQRQAMLMYTSCGWFFEDVSRIETIQILEYAARAMQLAQDLTGADLEPEFLAILEQAQSNDLAYGNGRAVYMAHVRPAIVDLPAVAAHYAMTMLFNGHSEQGEIYCYDAERLDYRVIGAGRARLCLGHVKLTSQITRECAEFSFAVQHLGDHNLDAGVRAFRGAEPYGRMVADLSDVFRRADFSGTVRAIDRHFGDHAYSLPALFRDEQRRILDQVLESTLGDVESVYRHLFEDHEAIIRFLGALGVPFPESLRSAAGYVISTDLRRAFVSHDLDADGILRTFEDTSTWDLDLDLSGLAFVLEQEMVRHARQLREHPERLVPAERLNALAALCQALPLGVDLRRPQNDYYHVLTTIYPLMLASANAGDAIARQWVDVFRALGKALSVQVE